ncbi:MAG TPA: nucleotidyl transferase AbiEii/AbiGii toxin family protein [Acidobacteriota bacterium]|nr:nucleotidyl transferase AbiEii/AbiGii toxin family protein [Acidobacteriota bacterium]
MFEFAQRQISDRIAFFETVAHRRGLSPLIVEKDFWICFILKILFENPKLSDVFVFKGGTSLSKVFNIIKRFSEDIDLSVEPKWLGFTGDQLPETSLSKTQINRRIKKLNEACIEAVEKKIQPILEEMISEILGPTNSRNPYLKFEIDSRTDSPVLYFNYPTKEYDVQGYIQPSVKLELGSLTDQEPTGRYAVSSWISEEFPKEFKQPEFKVISLKAQRTFWEKSTILHAEYHRPPEKQMRSHLSRDIYDVCQMAFHKSVKNALADFGLLKRVVDYKKTCFYARWKNYDAAKPGTFRLVPPDYRLSELKADYAKMEEMFYGEYTDFNELIEQLGKIEKKINSSV